MNGKDRMGRSDGSSLRLENESLSSEYEVFVCVAVCKIQKKKNLLSNIQQRNISHLTVLSKT